MRCQRSSVARILPRQAAAGRGGRRQPGRRTARRPHPRRTAAVHGLHRPARPGDTRRGPDRGFSAIAPPQFDLPTLTIAQAWHPRHEADGPHRWLRGCARDTIRQALALDPP
ncbi:hypothetical protein FMEAI12_3640100 [Parafrankia sp. Ea1.12]|nr:hypothetical protein FMEAI12_3640100 [Parafrankia sp. Ea1.12]